jgi:polysaccharide export outer membrane protein
MSEGAIGGGQEPADEEILTQLWRSRTREGISPDLSLGPGDVLEISVTPVAEVQNYAARISGDGMISLPLVGSMQAGGMSEPTLREEIHRRYLETYVRNPQVKVFVREYQSRLVAVAGAVARPGAYSLTKGNETLLDILSQAGGLSRDAAPRILLFPVEAYNPDAPVKVAASASVPLGGGMISPAVMRAEPLVISLETLARGGVQPHLSLPVRPGDVIMAPANGEVLVDGWVEKPGAYKITSGLTIRGAIAAAGGLSFAADPSSIRITRRDRQGERISLLVDLEKIKQGQSSDITVQEGDVIEIASSTPKLVPYGVYSFFTGVFRLGASVPLY